jgi:tetratricopeptide (TPR) repeat protein
MLWRLQSSKSQDTDEDKDKSKKQEPTEDDPTEVLDILGTLSLDLRATVMSLQGKGAEALDLFHKALDKEKALGYSEPPHLYRPEQESLGEAYLKTQEWEKARNAFAQALEQRPKSGHALYGIARSYVLAGDVPKAAQAYQEFLASWQNADPDLPQIKQAKSWLAAHPGPR